MAGKVARVFKAALQAGAIVVGRSLRSTLVGLYESATTGGAKRAPKSESEAAAAAASRPLKRIKREEALQILDIEEPFDRETLKERYEKLMDANSDKKGGSFYLQSKVFRAHERLNQDMEDEEELAKKTGEGEMEPIKAEEEVQAKYEDKETSEPLSKK
mmetsp:Transcript_27869/g.67753  ORF Transcript_27869/g.67753 Transcript_27869/m.67753 type:complete len:159 (-) Transcript_27869:186-662(-)|eukprot:CAMPEP_0114513514 /NCGR_PEP_ID=MMETSP0109-20121206/15619_1 /TAXON_ID=29199 /ORGANISM="Chlorarachnion reptans, Strain CCCM449" /LENGTH=158 /DNA_ID=CAMNT_0001693409 /DNA_START=100 /DNA_END=576 /DNA_ORIENTATION=+